jgi:G3E family GTPase
MPAMENQVKFSGVVLINKIDLVNDDIIPKIETKIKEFAKYIL